MSQETYHQVMRWLIIALASGAATVLLVSIIMGIIVIVREMQDW